MTQPGMTQPDVTLDRDDLFTSIHKALRLALFDLTVQAGRTDWTNPTDVAALGARWRPLLVLLHAHTSHEDQHILRILDVHDPNITEPIAEQHRDLEDLLDHVAERFEAVLADPAPDTGLALYRDLARFVAGYLPHLHEEETRIMARIWETCTDEELATTRAALTAAMSPDVTATTIEYMLPAVDLPTRRALVARVTATAPKPVVDMVWCIADRVLDATALAELRGALSRPADNRRARR